MKMKDESYEAMTQRLDAVIAALEKGSASLEETLKLYEEGVRLTDACEKYLAQARARIEVLVQDGDNMKTEPFETGDENE